MKPTPKLSNHRSSVYLTASLWIVPVLVLLVACTHKSPTPTGTAPKTSTRKVTASPTLAASLTASHTPTATPTVTILPSPTTTPSITPLPPTNLGADASDIQGAWLRFWYVSQTENSQGVLPALVYEFAKSNPWGITVEVVGYDSARELADSVEAARYKNDLPDLLAGYNYQAKGWDKDGKVFVDLNEYADDPVWGFSIAEQADFYPAFWQQDVTPSKRLGLPLRRTAVGLYYNVTWAKELGFANPPDTPESFRTQACAAAMATADGTGGWIITPDTPTLLGWVFAFGGDILSPDGKSYHMSAPENQEALEFLKGMEEDGCAWVAESRYPNAEFAGRKGLFVVGNSSGLLYQEEAFASLGANDHWTVIPFPGESRPPVVDVYGPALMITHSTPARQLAAWVFARWLISAEAQASWIRTEGGMPVRNATRGLLGGYATSHPQWNAFVYLLPYAQPEPSEASWELVRWMVADMSGQLFSSFFTAEQIPDLLQTFDQTAAEVVGAKP